MPLWCLGSTRKTCFRLDLIRKLGMRGHTGCIMGRLGASHGRLIGRATSYHQVATPHSPLDPPTEQVGATLIENFGKLQLIPSWRIPSRRRAAATFHHTFHQAATASHHKFAHCCTCIPSRACAHPDPAATVFYSQ